MKLIFKNKVALEYERAEEGSVFYDNAQRRFLEVQVAANGINIEALNKTLNHPSALDEITLKNDSDPENIIENTYNFYSIKMELAVRPVDVGTNEAGEPVKEERIVFRLGRLTTLEQKLKELGVL